MPNVLGTESRPHLIKYCRLRLLSRRCTCLSGSIWLIKWRQHEFVHIFRWKIDALTTGVSLGKPTEPQSEPALSTHTRFLGERPALWVYLAPNNEHGGIIVAVFSPKTFGGPIEGLNLPMHEYKTQLCSVWNNKPLVTHTTSFQPEKTFFNRENAKSIEKLNFFATVTYNGQKWPNMGHN